MSKKLNIIEAMKMPIGTKFEVLKEDGTKDICNVKIIEALERKGSKKLVVDNRAYIEIVVSDFVSTATFIPIQQPVSFMEAIEEGSEDKKIKVVMDRITFPKHFADALNKYMSLNEIFKFMSEHLSRVGIRNVIKEGKWYIEESEADFNE
ncbi:hypothetical protein ACUH7Y_06965 [Clostridium beijerinckii]|uniref:Uncharacterized protein n=1 Tax=Clostridium beijerinckii TaxID=1520 RepID=A0A7X9SQK9_CLOBE|nr:hypothetical protein [Clostridium beijerinckii]NMF06281.1 hypothetical protein [Clostridium beijerinckii]